MNGSHHVPTTTPTLFMVSKDEWDKKEGSITVPLKRNIALVRTSQFACDWIITD